MYKDVHEHVTPCILRQADKPRRTVHQARTAFAHRSEAIALYLCVFHDSATGVSNACSHRCCGRYLIENGSSSSLTVIDDRELVRGTFASSGAVSKHIPRAKRTCKGQYTCKGLQGMTLWPGRNQAFYSRPPLAPKRMGDGEIHPKPRPPPARKDRDKTRAAHSSIAGLASNSAAHEL